MAFRLPFPSWLLALFHRVSLHEPISHPETRVELATLAVGPRPFRPTYRFSRRYINENHQRFAECKTDGMCIDIGIPGWLTPDDALKLYELAYFAKGDILELGCYHGLSTSILAAAIRDSGSKKRLLSVDLHLMSLPQRKTRY